MSVSAGGSTAHDTARSITIHLPEIEAADSHSATVEASAGKGLTEVSGACGMAAGRSFCMIKLSRLVEETTLMLLQGQTKWVADATSMGIFSYFRDCTSPRLSTSGILRARASGCRRSSAVNWKA